MILADENLSPRIIQRIREAGIEVFAVKENRRGISDEEVIKTSKHPPRIILTEDKDFGEWVYAHQEKFISVILLRYKHSDLDKIISAVVNLIKERGETLYGKYTTVTISKIRSREI